MEFILGIALSIFIGIYILPILSVVLVSIIAILFDLIIFLIELSGFNQEEKRKNYPKFDNTKRYTITWLVNGEELDAKDLSALDTNRYMQSLRQAGYDPKVRLQ